MLASAPRLTSADRPMRTSVLRQRRGSARRQHLVSWAWRQGRRQVVGNLQSEQRTERYGADAVLHRGLFLSWERQLNEGHVYLKVGRLVSTCSFIPQVAGVRT